LLRERLKDRAITLSLSPQALDKIIEEGYDPVFGARPLKRVIQRRIENKLAQMILEGKISEGSQVEIDYEKGDYSFKTN
jgi:ATP-dependent Clp protease ATP-binding subunit ClpA